MMLMPVNYLPRQINKARINLKQTQTALAKSQQSTGLTSPGDQTKGLIGQLMS